MKEKEAWKRRIEAQLDEWKAETEKWKARTKRKKAESDIEIDNILNDLENKQEIARKKLQKLEESGNEAWDEIKEGIESAANELKDTYNKASKKFN
jgi:hypothetical protein